MLKKPPQPGGAPSPAPERLTPAPAAPAGQAAQGVRSPLTGTRREAPRKLVTPSTEQVELFFNTGIVFHEVRGELPDLVAGYTVMHGGQQGAATTGGNAPQSQWSMRRAAPGEDPDVEISVMDHLAEFAQRWIPLPYQLSGHHAVQVYLNPRGAKVQLLMAIDTLEAGGARGRCLDAALDEGRPFRPLEAGELAYFLDHNETRDFVQRLERTGVERAVFKLAAFIEAVGPLLPRLKFMRLEHTTPIPVSLVLDFGNSRSSAVLVESRDQGMVAVPLALRSFGNPFEVNEENFDSRVTFMPSPFDKGYNLLATGEGFQWPSIARLGREARDRALETPHRFQCTLSGPKRYLWDPRPTEEKWHFAKKQEHTFPTVSGRLLKFLVEDAAGLGLREDGPSAPPDPRYAPRTMMLFSLVEILSQAYAQVNAVPYRTFQGKEGNPRFLKHVVLTYPSGMSDVERGVYDALVRNAVILTCHLLNIRADLRPNWNPQTGTFDPFLFADEALAAQMVYLYEEVKHRFGGSMEDFAEVYGRSTPAPTSPARPVSAVAAPTSNPVRVASIDIGGGTTDVMIAEYQDRMPGTGTSLEIKKLFQDGVNVAGDEVCRAIVEDAVWSQLLPQVPDAEARRKLADLFAEGDAGLGSAWRTLRARLVPNYWLPLARAFWAVAEGQKIPDHAEGKVYAFSDFARIFPEITPSAALLDEADRFLSNLVPTFPGLRNIMFRFDAKEIDRAVARVMREPLRRYADIIAQFDVDLLVLAGRAAKLRAVRDILLAEMPVTPPRLVSMADYEVSEWYPSKWREGGKIKDPKSTVTAGAAILHLASRNRLPSFLIDRIEEHRPRPIFGLFQDAEPQVAHENELFRNGGESAPFFYTSHMRIGFRNVDSEQMDGSPLYEVSPASPRAEQALLDQRVMLTFGRGEDGHLFIKTVTSPQGSQGLQGAPGDHLEPSDFVLRLKTLAADRYWLDTGVFRVPREVEN
jgi:hypothetical protein